MGKGWHGQLQRVRLLSLRAGVTRALGARVERIGNVYKETILVAALGGTLSELTGGKFANGAVTAAFSYTFGRISANARSSDARKRLIAALDDEQRRFVEFLDSNEGQGVLRTTDEQFSFEMIASANGDNSFDLDFDPGGYAGLVRKLGIHDGYQLRLPSISNPGEYHISFERFELGDAIYVHYDAVSVLNGPMSAIVHGLAEVLPTRLLPRIPPSNNYDNIE